MNQDISPDKTNSNSSDIPLGFGMQLAQQPGAMEKFGRMSQAEREALIAHIQASKTGTEAKNRIADAVTGLGNGQLM